MTDDNAVKVTFYDELKHKIWVTKGTRFNAYARLKNKNNWSYSTLALLSAYVLILTLINYLFPDSLRQTQETLTTFSSITLAILILTLSLIEISQNYTLKARDFHDCGRKLSGLYDRLCILIDTKNQYVSIDDFYKHISAIDHEYNEILDSCKDNHDTIDFDTFKIQHKDEYPMSIRNKFMIRVGNLIHSTFYYILLIFIPPILFIILFIYI